VFFWNHLVRKNSGMKETNMIKNEDASTVTRAIAVKTMNKIPEITNHSIDPPEINPLTIKKLNSHRQQASTYAHPERGGSIKYPPHPPTSHVYTDVC
jgi:hypothetical protein